MFRPRGGTLLVVTSGLRLRKKYPPFILFELTELPHRVGSRERGDAVGTPINCPQFWGYFCTQEAPRNPERFIIIFLFFVFVFRGEEWTEGKTGTCEGAYGNFLKGGGAELFR